MATNEYKIQLEKENDRKIMKKSKIEIRFQNDRFCTQENNKNIQLNIRMGRFICSIQTKKTVNVPIHAVDTLRRFNGFFFSAHCFSVSFNVGKRSETEKKKKYEKNCNVVSRFLTCTKTSRIYETLYFCAYCRFNLISSNNQNKFNFLIYRYV